MRSFVTVVTGVPRSGTSLSMQMLAAGGMPLLCDASRPPDAEARIAAFLGGELDVSAMVARVDPSLHRQRLVAEAVP